MLHTPANLSAMFTAFSMQYRDGYGNAEIFWRRCCTLVPSTTETLTHGWMDKIPKLREWIGPRVIQNAVARSRVVENKTFELTLGIPKEKIEDDTYGLYSPQALSMGEQSAKWPDDLVAPLFLENPVCFDGRPMFDANHPINIERGAAGGVYSNVETGFPLTLENYAEAKTRMRTFKGRDGRTLGVQGSLLVVPPSLEGTARTILSSQYYPKLADGASLGNGDVAMVENVWRGTADLLVIDELEENPGDWFLLDVRKAIKPFVFQLRKAPVFTYLTSPTDPNVFFNREFVMGVEARGNADVSLPFLAFNGQA